MSLHSTDPEGTNPESPSQRWTLHAHWRSIAWTLTLTVLILAGLELMFRWWSPVQDYGGWENPNLYKKVKGAEQAYEENDKLDLVLLGTSIGRPIDVNLWEDAMGYKVVCYNAAYPDARPQLQRFMFEKYYWPRFKPGHVVYALAPSDLNSSFRGMHPDRRRAETVWSYHMVRRLDPGSLKERVKVALERVSVFLRTRKKMRSRLQQGEIATESVTPSIGRGVTMHTIRRIPPGPQTLSWARMPEYLQHNALHQYWVPYNGELGELMALGEFCRLHGVKMTVLEVPLSPYGLSDFDDIEQGMKLFYEALDKVERAGIPVVRLPPELHLDNAFFEDQFHMNRWGSEVLTNFAWQKVVKPWFPDKALVDSLPESHQVDLYKAVTPAPGVRVERRLAVPPAAGGYLADKQVVVEGTSVAIPVVAEAAPGRYSVGIYAGDGTTTTRELTNRAKIQLQAVADGKIHKSIQVDKWALNHLGISYAQALVTAETTATIQIQAEVPPGEPLILDVAFVRRMVSTGPDVLTVEEGLVDGRP